MALQTDADTYTEPRCCRGWLSHSGKKNNYIIDIECPFESRRSRSPTNCTFTSYLFIFGIVINKYKNVTLFLRILCQGYNLYDATRLSEKWWFKYSAALPFIASTHYLIWYFLNTPINLLSCKSSNFKNSFKKSIWNSICNPNFIILLLFIGTLLPSYHLAPQGEDEPIATPRMTINHA